jgi:ABC-type multidrug transport system ATPase subunit
MEDSKDIRKSYQIRALLRKSATLQLRQKGTNCCQIFTPILCLFLVYLMKEIAGSQLEKNEVKPVELETIPRILNPPVVPNYVIYNLLGLEVTSCEQWYYYDIQSEDPSVANFVGNLTGEYSEEYDTRSGLLGNISNYDCDTNMRRNPFFASPQTTINEDIYNTLKIMNSNPIRNGVSIYLSELPDGSVTFYEANSTHLKYKAQINDNRFMSYHRNNGITKIESSSYSLLTITDGMLTLMDMLHQAYFRTLFNSTEILTLVQYMPIQLEAKAELDRLLNILGASLYPIALSLLLPVFMYSIVLEKEEKLQDFMKMNGMKIINYWVVGFCFNFAIYSITVFIFMIFGLVIVQLQFFSETSPAILILMLLGWGICQISLAFFIQVFISKARTATIWGYLLSIWTVLWGITLNLAVYPLPREMPNYLIWYPHFAFTRSIYILSQACGYYKCMGSLSEMSSELKKCIILMYVIGIITLCLALYLNEIMPREFGVPRHPLFCIRKKKEARETLLQYDVDLSSEDVAVKEETKKVHTLSYPFIGYPLVVKDLRKVYKGKTHYEDKIAVKCMNLKIEDNELFGLLGPNGAGKTTLISMLTGLYGPDGGDAWIGGFSITQELEQVQLYMGVCPQFDILWPDLTVLEHLLFYARLKGISPSEENESVNRAMSEVYLTKFKDLKSTQLSGGMRRRLSVAISLVGNPKIVFLDEPTTGLDPENRRQLWDILAKCKGGRAMVLTTHSMEEADVLCSRVAIVHDGVLRCIGPQVVLKSLYGGGYHLFINCHRSSGYRQDELIPQIKDFVSKVLPSAGLLSEFNGNLVYQIPIDTCKVSVVFSEFESNKAKIGIADWGISQSSLEDVFMKVIGED